ncbi:MAG: TolC family protein [Flammeovirgaceae bacterium]
MKYITTFILAFITISVYAQESWSLDECISYAMANNLELKDLKYNEASESENHKQSYRNLLPTVQGAANYTINYGRSVDPITNGYITNSFFSNTYTLNGTLEVFRGFQKLNMIKAADLLRKAAQEDIQQEKYMLAFRVMSAFYDIRFAEEFVKLSEGQLGISEENYAFIKRRVELGQLAKADLYEAEALVATDKLALAQAENQWKEAQMRLIQEMNLPNAAEIQLKADAETFMETAYEGSQDSVYQNALAFMPVIKSQQLQLDAARKEIAAARGSLYPSLTFTAGYFSGYFETLVDAENNTLPFWTQIEVTTAKRIGFNLSVPIFNRGLERSRIQQRKIEFERSANNLNRQKQELYNVIQELIRNQKAIENELALSIAQVESQEIAFAIAQKRYKKGMISVLELHRAKNMLASAQNEKLQVKMRLKVNKKTLDFYNGLPIFNNVISD